MLSKEFVVIHEPRDVELRLGELGLSKIGLERAAEAAYGSRMTTTKNHPSNAAGMYSYMDGVKALRDEFLGEHWARVTDDGAEYIENSEGTVKVGFCNVQVAGSLVFDPMPISKRGDATQRRCHSNSQQFSLPFDQSDEGVRTEQEVLTYYLFVGVDGTAELSLSLACESGKFDEMVERIFIITPDELSDEQVEIPEDEGGSDIEISVNRKV